MSIGCKHDNFDKLSKEVKEAEEGCAHTYAIWSADVERLRRLERLRHDAWMELLETITSGNSGTLTAGGSMEAKTLTIGDLP